MSYNSNYRQGGGKVKEYLEQVMHQSIDVYKYINTKNIPLGCRNAFALNIVKIGQQKFLLAAPVEEMNLTELRKMRIQLERYTGYLCAFYLKKVNWYAASKMVEEGIPFVWEKHQVYLPFIGILLQKNFRKTLPICTVISFLTQKLLIKALYEGWQNVSAVRASEMLAVSRMSITRCYDEIEGLGMPFLKKQGRSRRFYAMKNKKEMWDTMFPFLRNPIIRIFRLEKKPDADMILSGISALAEYSLLGEDACVTYAVRKDQIGTLGLEEIRKVPCNEDAACIVQEVGYTLPFGENTAVDPLSLVMMLTKDELEDPRVELCVNEMLEELVW